MHRWFVFWFVLACPLTAFAQSSPGAPPPPGAYPPPPAWYPPPPSWYAPPGSGEHKEAPKTLPYRDGEAAPPGYVLESGPRRGLVIAGSVTFGTLYGLTLLGASGSDGDDVGWLYLPVLGPLIYAQHNQCDTREEEYCADKEAANVFLTLDALGQAAGVVLFTLGMLNERKRWVRADRAASSGPSVTIAPTASVRGSYGLSAVGSF